MRYFSKGIVMTFSIQRGCFCSRIYLRGRDHLGTGHTRLMWLIKIKAERRLRRYGLLFLLLSFTTCVWIALWFHHKSILPAVTAVAACWPCLIELRNAPPPNRSFCERTQHTKGCRSPETSSLWDGEEAALCFHSQNEHWWLHEEPCQFPPSPPHV